VKNLTAGAIKQAIELEIVPSIIMNNYHGAGLS
jgi:hypothetical protein